MGDHGGSSKLGRKWLVTPRVSHLGNLEGEQHDTQQKTTNHGH